MTANSSCTISEDTTEPRNGSQKTGLLTGVWTATFLMMVAVSTFSYVQLKNIHIQQVAAFDSGVANLVRVNEEHALRTFRAADQTLLFMMNQYAAEQDQLDLAAMVTSGVIDGSLFPQAGIIDSSGALALSSVPFVKGLDLSDRAHFKVHMADDRVKLFISPPVLGRASGKWTIQLTRRIDKPDGSFGGVAVVSINVAYFTKFYDDLVLPEKSVAVLAGFDGIVRARLSDEDSSAGQNLSASHLYKMLADGKSSGRYIAKSQIDGIERTFFFRAVADFPLVVIAGYATNSLIALHDQSSLTVFIQSSELSALPVFGGAGGIDFSLYRAAAR